MKENATHDSIREEEWPWKFRKTIILVGIISLTSFAWDPISILAKTQERGKGGASVPRSASGLGYEEIICPQEGKKHIEKKIIRDTLGEEIKVNFVVPRLGETPKCLCWKDSSDTYAKWSTFHQRIADRLNGNKTSSFYDDYDRADIQNFYDYVSTSDNGLDLFKEEFEIREYEDFTITLEPDVHTKKGPNEDGKGITCVSRENFKDYLGSLRGVLEHLLGTNFNE